MTLIIVLLFFKSLCLYLQNIVLFCYDKFLNPRQKYYTGGGGGSSSTTATSGSSYHQRQRSSHSSSALNKARANEREELLEKIRSRKRAAKLRT